MNHRVPWITLFLCTLVPFAAEADSYHTPLAGQEYRGEVGGEQAVVPARNRRDITAIDVGAQWFPSGPSGTEVMPLGSLFLWRNPEDGLVRFRGILAGAYDDVRVNYRPSWLQGLDAIVTFENYILPFDQFESVEGIRQKPADLNWYYVRAGFGLGYRTTIDPGHQDNEFEISLSYEPGFFWFDQGKNSAPTFKDPTDTYEGRVHLFARVDALERNVMELPHRGFATGMDLIYGHRSRWKDWGGPVFGVQGGSEHRDYFSGAAYALWAGGVPFVDSERHRLILAAHGGLGSNLDRFSAFRLPGRPTGWEWATIALPVLPGASFNEFFPRSYGILNMVYRYEALFFVYPYVRASWSWVDRLRFEDNGRIGNRMDSLPALSAGVVSGAPWNSQVEVNYAYNFGILRDYGKGPQYGGHGVFVLWSKEF